jgi:CRP-like cAMP-binding protein
MARRGHKTGTKNLSDLIAAKDYAGAIDMLREQFTKRPPGIQRRLQLGDLLILAGRNDEAIPILMGLAEELQSDGFTSKAVAILKRVDRLEPGRADVESRLSELAQRPPSSEIAPPPAEAEEAVAKESVAKEPVAETATTATEPASEPAEAPKTETPTESAAPPTKEAEPEAERTGITSMFKRLFRRGPAKSDAPPVAAEAANGEAKPTEESPAAAVAESDVPHKLDGVFKKFVAALPGGSGELAAPTDDDLVEEGDGDFADSFIDDEDIPEAPAAPITPVVVDPIPAPAPVAARKGGSSPITEETFRDQVLDLLEDVLRQPPAAAPGEPDEEPPLAAYRDTLRAHPLFADLESREMLAVLRALHLSFAEPGDIVVTEGEPGASLFLIISGDLRLFVLNPSGHNVEVGRLAEGAFFGEMSLLSGRPRNATITAATRVEMLELPKPMLDAIAQAHPRVRDVVDALYLQRANSEDVAAVRNVPTGDRAMYERAKEILRTYFGGRRFEPRMQLKLAVVLLKAGKYEEAVPVLVTVAHELLQEDTAKAIAILKKVEMIRTRSLQFMSLAPLDRDPGEDTLPPTPLPVPQVSTPAWAGRTAAFFDRWLSEIIRQGPSPATPSRRIPGYAPELRAHPLFEGFSEEELLALIQGLRLSAFEPGEIVLTEGEPGESVFILASGVVKVSVRDPRGHNNVLCELKEGTFFGEISTLSGRPRSATVTAATRCELLELDRPTLDAIAAKHPRVRQVLEDAYIERAGNTAAERIRTADADLRPEP